MATTQAESDLHLAQLLFNAGWKSLNQTRIELAEKKKVFEELKRDLQEAAIALNTAKEMRDEEISNC